MNTNIIKRVEIAGLFNRHKIRWELNPDVNILVGINGIGKTTILKTIHALLSKKYSCIRDWEMAVEIRLADGGILAYPPKNNPIRPNYTYITTFDVPLRDKAKIRQSETPLDKELEEVIYSLGKENQRSFSNYRFKATNYPESAGRINKRIEILFQLINECFADTGKRIDIDRSNNRIVFHVENTVIGLERLSSGEKQMLLILFSVFLMEEEPYILLMDEPEISLHIGWQQKLIDIIRQLNPNCQLIMATHSPSIFGEGWGNKLFFVKDLSYE
jgi:predicted ATP-binding protein involved in virulence